MKKARIKPGELKEAILVSEIRSSMRPTLPPVLKIRKLIFAAHLLDRVGALATLKIGKETIFLHECPQTVTIGAKPPKTSKAATLAAADIQIDDPAIAREHILICHAPDKESLFKLFLPDNDQTKISLQHADGQIIRITAHRQQEQLDLVPLLDGDRIFLGSSQISADGVQSSYLLEYHTVKDAADFDPRSSELLRPAGLRLCDVEKLPLRIADHARAVDEAIYGELRQDLSGNKLLTRRRAFRDLLSRNTLEGWHILLTADSPTKPWVRERLDRLFARRPELFRRLSDRLANSAGGGSQQTLVETVLQQLNSQQLYGLLQTGALLDCAAAISDQTLAAWRQGFHFTDLNKPALRSFAIGQLIERAKQGNAVALRTLTQSLGQQELAGCLEIARQGDSSLKTLIKENVAIWEKSGLIDKQELLASVPGVGQKLGELFELGPNEKYLRPKSIDPLGRLRAEYTSLIPVYQKCGMNSPAYAQYSDFERLPKPVVDQILDLYSFEELLAFCRNSWDIPYNSTIYRLAHERMIGIAGNGGVAEERRQAKQYLRSVHDNTLGLAHPDEAKTRLNGWGLLPEIIAFSKTPDS